MKNRPIPKSITEYSSANNNSASPHKPGDDNTSSSNDTDDPSVSHRQTSPGLHHMIAEL